MEPELKAKISDYLFESLEHRLNKDYKDFLVLHFTKGSGFEIDTCHIQPRIMLTQKDRAEIASSRGVSLGNL
jgi:hypothetical protein